MTYCTYISKTLLWEEDHKSYLRNLIADIRHTLRAIGCGDVFIKKHNDCAIDINKVDCDAYEYKKDNPDAVRMYRGGIHDSIPLGGL